jgi:hypothetical protein
VFEVTFEPSRATCPRADPPENVTQTGIVTVHGNVVEVPVALAIVRFESPSPPTRIDRWHDASKLTEEGESP